MNQTPVLCITFVYHPSDQLAGRLVLAASELVEGLGVERQGIFMRVPVRVRSRSLDKTGTLRPIDPTASSTDVVVYCQSAHLDVDGDQFQALLHQVHGAFQPYDTLLCLPVLFCKAALPSGFERAQGIRWYEWDAMSEEQRITRALIRIFGEIRNTLSKSATTQKSRIFISHAKRDGVAIAEALVRYIRDPANQLGLETFYDALELRDGEDFAAGLEAGIKNSALLVLVSDAFETRAWCNKEVLIAKSHGRPILVLDLGRKKVIRMFPYLGNLPLRRHDLRTSTGCDDTILDLIVEMLRVELFQITAAQCDPEARALPRPPELLDLVALSSSQATRVLYPDPPLPDQELKLLSVLAPDIRFETLDESMR